MEFRKLLGDDYPLGTITVTSVAEDADFYYVAVSPPEPGTICPTCNEKTPSKGALYMREWRRRKRG